MVDIDQQIIKRRRNWKAVVLDYPDLISEPVDNSECCYCLTVPQAQALIAVAQTFSWPTRWANFDGNVDAIQAFSDDIIRRLIMSCCGDEQQTIPTLTQVTENYDLQISTDGGDTYYNDPRDPRLTVPTIPPLPEDTPDRECQEAYNVRKGFESAVSQIAEVLGATLTLLAIATAIVGIIGVLLLDPANAYRLIPVVISLAGYLVGVTSEEYTATFTDEVFDDLECIVKCLVDENGHIDKSALIAQINATFTGIPRNTFLMLAYVLGGIMLDVMAATNGGTVPEGECDDCDCGEACPNFADFEVAYRGTVIGSPTAHKVTVESTFASGHDVIIFTSHPEALLTSTDYSDLCCTMYIKVTTGEVNESTRTIRCGNNYNANLDVESVLLDGLNITENDYWIQLSSTAGTFRVEFTDTPNP